MDRAKTMCFYGVSGTAKTSQAYHVAKWVYEKLGKITRLVSRDPGGWESAEINNLRKLGIVQTIDLNDPKFSPLALATVRYLADGRWYIGLAKKSGVPVFRMTEDWSKIGAYFIEGLTSIGDGWMRHIASQTDRIGPQDVSGRYEEGGEMYGGNSEGHYNIVQNELARTVVSFGGLPVDYVIWTAHVGPGTDRLTGKPVYCPQLVGNKKNSASPSWFGDCFHFEHVWVRVQSDREEKKKRRVRAWFINHENSSTSDNFLAKSRVPTDQVDKLEETWPNGYILLSPTNGIQQYLDFLHSLGEEAAQSLDSWKQAVDKER